MSAAKAMMPICVSAKGKSSEAAAAATARPAVNRVVASEPAMPRTASATTATATSASPPTTPVSMPMPDARPSPSAAMTSADGSVKPRKAATAPPSPAFS